MFLCVATQALFQEKGWEWGGICDFTPRETSFIHFGGSTTLKKVAWPAWSRENADGIPNNVILMSWKIPGPSRGLSRCYRHEKRYRFIELRLPSLSLTRGKYYYLNIKTLLYVTWSVKLFNCNTFIHHIKAFLWAATCDGMCLHSRLRICSIATIRLTYFKFQ